MKKIWSFLLLTVTIVLLTSCSKEETCKDGFEKVDGQCVESLDFNEIYKEHGAYYQLFVRSFADSDGDGIGDFNGITEKLDYLVELGVEGIWLMPIHPSPTYHGYDVLDYYGVNPEYGTLEDFENMLDVAEQKGIKVIIDFVLNHTSVEHPWFIEWKNGNPEYEGFYRSISSGDERKNSNGAWGQNIWHSYSGGYYCGYFSNTMPDLNWSNQAVQDEMLEIATYWLEKGVDGFRLDAALHLEGLGEVKSPTVPITSTLFLLERFEYLIEEQYPDVYIVGEVWEDYSVSSLFFSAMDSSLNFEVGDQIITAVQSGFHSSYVQDIEDNLSVMRERDENGIDAPFLKNHDQDRLASILSNENELKMAAEMLLTLEGNPFIYYGEEIGMKGIKSTGPIWDETRRLPLLFDDEYRTTWMIDEYNQNVDSVQEQIANENSLFHTYSSLLHARKDSLALKYGMFVASESSTAIIPMFYRVFNYDDKHQEAVMVIHNLSGYDMYYEDYEELSMDDVIYYSGGADSFDGMIGNYSTLIVRVDFDKVDLGNE